MKKYFIINLLFVLLASSSCGVDSSAKAGTGFVERRSFLNLAAADYEKIDNNIRSTTFLIYPKASDLDGFEFNTATAQSWKGVKEILPYGDKVQTVIPRSMPSFEKSSQVIFTIISAGQARDDAYLAKQKAVEKLSALEDERAELLSDVKKELRSLGKKTRKKVCYYKERPADGEKYICQLTPDDVFLEDNDRKARNCEKFLEHEYINTNEEEKLELDQLAADCTTQLNKEQEINNGPISDKIAAQQEIETRNSQYRDDGKQVVIDILKAVEAFNPNVFLTTGAENEKGTDVGPYSRINFSKNDQGQTVIDEFLLLLDLGTNYSEGAGFKEYSLANGKIQDLRHYVRGPLETVLEFKVVTSDFTIEAELFESSQPYHGLRYVGDLIVRYPNGDTREGVGKIEISELSL